MLRLPVVLIAALALAPTATAGLIVPFSRTDSQTVIKQKIEVNLKHTRFVCKYGTGQIRANHCQATRWLVRWLNKLTAPILLIPHKSAWLCIHRFEGSWTDSGDPYWGGLQMDRGFMQSYAPKWLLRKGWANTWTPAQQMWVAERAYSSGRGFWPWPNTARYCHLL